jgi:hypothetical protein
MAEEQRQDHSGRRRRFAGSAEKSATYDGTSATNLIVDSCLFGQFLLLEPEIRPESALQTAAGLQRHHHSGVTAFGRARWTIRSSDFVRRLSCHFGRSITSRHPDGDGRGCQIGEGHRAIARRRRTAGTSRGSIRRGYNDRHWCLTWRTGHFHDQARTADQRASGGTGGTARGARASGTNQCDRE